MDDSSERDSGQGGVLEGLRVVVVEDEFFLAYALEEDLRSFGCEVVGTFSSLDESIAGAAPEMFDFAVLDINLNGTMVYPFADHLMARGIPFIFVSGYEQAHLPERFRAVERLGKPHDLNRLRQAIAAAVER